MLTLGGAAFGFLVPALAGYISYAIADRPGIAPGFVMGAIAGTTGSGFIGGIIGGAIDATSGAMNDLKPNPLIVTLRTPAEEAAARAAAPAAGAQAATQQ